MTNEPFTKFLPMTSAANGSIETVTPDVLVYTNQIVNLFFIRLKGDAEWVLVDAGMPKSGDSIKEEAEKLFGEGARPKAILLTHGHFDHIGGLGRLLEFWPGVPVFAHEMELPFLTGMKDYPEPDSSVEGGLVAKMSRMFPNEGIDISGSVKALPEDGSVPDMPEWKWIHTPGHSPGHISLFRERDRILIAGDAFVTVRQDELYKVMTQKKEITGPPRYLTTDWKAAKESVLKLNALSPLAAGTGHGLPVFGEDLQSGLQTLASEFDSLAVPDHGKYVE
ncbi:MBL fold metallo-hydrolase [Peribacillus sp. SCS-37]|uniref:MBL fold metallo-hydrolase n=1 Tax=Paraperibacillus esterisolvens TaxID=3115296 RepID=UPI0039064083